MVLTPTAYEECSFRDTYTAFPGELYLAHTVERAGSAVHVPKIEGKSTLARLGLSIHVTAGYGDVGFVGAWTLRRAPRSSVRYLRRPAAIAAKSARGSVFWRQSHFGPACHA